MKIAFVHCRIQPGGALNVLKDIVDEQTNMTHAKIFTVFSDCRQLKTLHHKLSVVTALPKWMNALFLRCSKKHIPLLSRLFDYRNLMFFYPSLMRILSRKIRKYNPEYIVISSFAVAKNITPISGVKTMLYIHSPMQYIRSHYDEYHKKLTGLKGKLFNRIVPKLREWDLKYTKFDTIYANSEYTSELIHTLYHMTSEIKYPRISQLFTESPICDTPLPYYVFMGRLVTFVREADLIITFFNQLNLPLIVIGTGPDEEYIRSLAKDNVMFVGRISDPQERVKILSQARGLINLTKESYGMGTVEALLLGVPVFGYHEGGTAELVENHSGILVPDKKLATLIKQFQLFHDTQRNRQQIATHMRRKLQHLKK